MRDFSRRSLLGLAASLGIASALPTGAAGQEDHSGRHAESPHLEKYVQPVPIPEQRSPDGHYRGAEFHDVELEETTHEFHPDLGETTIWGFDGQFPGPVLEADRGERLAVRFDNSGLPSEHLFEVDERIPGTTTDNYVDYDGPVPEVRNVTHFHGLNVDPSNDGQADMWRSPDGVTGPRFDDEVQMLPNRQARLTAMYHDHARGISRLNNYAGLVGPYFIRSRNERHMDLPEDEYEVPLVLADRTFHDDGSLFYPDEFMATFGADTMTVNGAVWPYMEVEPRRYRFRIVNLSNSRTVDLGFESASDDHDDVPVQYQLSASHGFLDEVVSIGHGDDLESLVIAPFERAEIVVDFSEYAGETFTLENGAEFPYEGGGHRSGGHSSGSDGDMDMGHGGIQPTIDDVMQFRVADSVSEPDRSTHPTELDLPDRHVATPEAAQTTREITMGMGMDDDGLMIHNLNGNHWGDDIEVEPQLGTTEIWELVNNTDHTHPIHLHLVEFQVLERERHDTDHGPKPPLPNERGGKDTVRVDPGETVRIAVRFGDFGGKFPFHCHILEHEEHDMMRMFDVQGGRGDGRGRDDDRDRGDRDRDRGDRDRDRNRDEGR